VRHDNLECRFSVKRLDRSGGWLPRLLTHPVGGLDNFKQAFHLLETAKEAIKVYYEVA
jgi:hypothetical protein